MGWVGGAAGEKVRKKDLGAGAKPGRDRARASDASGRAPPAEAPAAAAACRARAAAVSDVFAIGAFAWITKDRAREF